MRAYLLTVLLGCQLAALAQPSISQLRETSTTFLRQGDHTNAILVLNRALQQDPKSMQLLTDLTYAYYLQRDFSKAMEIMKPLLDREDAEERTYQIAGNVYKSIAEINACEKMYRKALKKYPESGVLHSEYGELLLSKKEPSAAIENWEKGIQADPGYYGNYYHAARYYDSNGDILRGIIYAEIYLNMDSYSSRTPEIKSMLLEAYKNFFVEIMESRQSGKKRTPFEESLREVLARQASMASMGLNVDRLVMIRTRFVLDWFNELATSYPHKLLEHQQQLLQEGLFEAYNQWLFGAASNVLEYQNWVDTHAGEMADYTEFQRKRIFRMPQGQYYLAD